MDDVAQARQLPAKVHLMCAWPMILVAVGGLLGGALGGAAYGVNLAIYKSQMADRSKIALNLLTGVAAIAAWVAIATFLLSKMR